MTTRIGKMFAGGNYQALEDANERAGKLIQEAYASVVENELVQQCTTHPRYQVKRRPRVPCEACWRMWIAKNP